VPACGSELLADRTPVPLAGQEESVSHFVIGWFVRYVLDAPWWRWMGLNQFNCALTIIKVSDGEPPALVTFNDIGHLPADPRGEPPVRLLS
jgi:hypothetical protein